MTRRSIERRVGSVLGRACFRGAHAAMAAGRVLDRVSNRLREAGLRWFRLGFEGPAFTVMNVGDDEPEEDVDDGRRWSLEIAHEGAWEPVRDGDAVRTYASEDEALDLARDLFPHTDHLSMMCRAVEVSRGG